MKTKKNSRQFKRVKTSKQRKTNKKNNKVHTRSRKQFGGLYEHLTSFRDQFKDYLLPLINWENKSKNAIKDTYIPNIKRFFINNSDLINTLIPIDSDRRFGVDKNIVDFVSIPTIILENVTNKDIKTKLLQSFYENGGNINAYNNLSIKKETAFIRAVENRQLENVKILLDGPYGLTVDNLPEEDRPILEEMLKPVIEPVLEPVLEPSQESVIEQEPEPLIKLVIPFPLPNENTGYNPQVAPDFWKPIFKETSLMDLREKIRRWLSKDTLNDVSDRLKDKQVGWKTCQLVEGMFPTYYTKQNPDFNINPQDFININTTLCITLIILGIVSRKMEGQDYNFIFKGGKAVQFVLSEIQNASKYISDDIDILITGNEYNAINMKNLAAHTGYLIQWFFAGNYNISLEFPNSNLNNMGKEIVKVSYKNSANKFTALADIGFDKPNANVEKYFMHPQEFKINVKRLKEELLFRCPNIDALLNEKLYYYLKFIEMRGILKQGLPIHENGYQDTTIDNLNFYMIKFKKSIKAIVDGLLLQNFGIVEPKSLKENEEFLLKEVLRDFTSNNEFKQELIDAVTDPNPYNI
jgi:hypothetical protein